MRPDIRVGPEPRPLFPFAAVETEATSSAAAISSPPSVAAFSWTAAWQESAATGLTSSLGAGQETKRKFNLANIFYCMRKCCNARPREYIFVNLENIRVWLYEQESVTNSGSHRSQTLQ